MAKWSSAFCKSAPIRAGSDYERYPRPEQEDEEFCRKLDVDLLFRPSATQMYPDNRSVFVEKIRCRACSKANRGREHFRGVCTVVAKLFNILQPDAAVFGEKGFSNSWPSFAEWVRDLNYRSTSSRSPRCAKQMDWRAVRATWYLNAEERKQATVLRRALLAAKDPGKKSAKDTVDLTRKIISEAPLARIDYVDLVDADTLQPIESPGPNSLLALAVFFGKTRLIDNIVLR